MKWHNFIRDDDSSQCYQFSSRENIQYYSEKKPNKPSFCKLSYKDFILCFNNSYFGFFINVLLVLTCIIFSLSVFFYLTLFQQPIDLACNRSEYQDISTIQAAIDTINATEIREWSHAFSNNLHIAGKGKDLATWTLNQFKRLGLDDSYIESFYVYLNEPDLMQLDLINASSAEVIYSASLKEDPISEDPTTTGPGVPVFHGYSKSGEVTAQYVYGNYGRKQDFELLAKNGISVKDKIVLVRYNRLFRGLKVKNAEECGAVGVIIFTDPTDDQGLDFTNGFEAYPDGPARHPSSVQRGNVGFLVAPGDPTTHGYASTEGSKRKRNLTGIIPSIPSIPISYRDAVPLLQELDGKGDIYQNWTGILNATYSTGPSVNLLHLINQQTYDYKPIHNVFGVVEGKNTDQAIIIGNHRDSWVVGGAADPTSGSAVLLALAKALGELRRRNLRPERTIILASWDGEEYGLLGSTEWGEKHEHYLKEKVLVYVNVDGAVSGSYFKGGASPSLTNLLKEVTKFVDYPNGCSLYEHWKNYTNNTVSLLGTGSDYTVFLDYLGIPSIDFSFKPGRGDPIYHYHSNYDSFHFMDTRIDKDWKLHSTAAKLLIRLSLELADREVINFDYEEYSNILQSSLDRLLQKYDVEKLSFHKFSFQTVGRYFRWKSRLTGTCNAHSPTEYLKCLQDSLQAFNRAAVNRKKDWNNYCLLDDNTNRKRFNTAQSIFQSEYKKRIDEMLIERLFLVEKGLDSRPWYKHALIAPNKETGYGASLWPALIDAFEENDSIKLMDWVSIYISMLDRATEKLTESFRASGY